MPAVRLICVWFVLLACCTLPLRAENYPARPLRLIVPFTPAGATDLLARIVGEGLSQRLGQRVVIENKPGAGANIGADLVAQAVPDGYTLLMAPASVYAISMSLYARPSYDLVRDFAPVSTIANVPHVLVVAPSVSARTLKEFIALARARPDALNLASQGVGTVSHLEGEMFEQMAGVQLMHVPYKGSAPALLDVFGGAVEAMFDSIASTLPHIRAGKLRAIAVTAEKRASVLPEVPTFVESGLPGYKAESWLGILVPARTPPAIVQRLNHELTALLADAKTRRTLIDRGFEPLASTPQQFAERIRFELALWARVVKTSGATIE